MQLISIISPCLNEENSIKDFYEKISAILRSISQNYEILLVDDGSTDQTWKIITEISKMDSRLKAIKLSRNFGIEAAVLAGLVSCKGDAAIIMDSDLQDPPECIPLLLAKWGAGCHLVTAKRKSRKGETFLKKISAKLYYRILNFFASRYIPNDTGLFRLVDRVIIDTICSLKEKNIFIREASVWSGFKQDKIEFDRQKRGKGATKFTLKKMFTLAVDGLITQPSFLPRFYLYFCLLALMLYLFFGIIFELTPFFIGLFLLCMLIAFMGSMGVYVTYIFDEVRQRPRYIVEDKLNFE